MLRPAVHFFQLLGGDGVEYEELQPLLHLVCHACSQREALLLQSSEEVHVARRAFLGPGLVRVGIGSGVMNQICGFLNFLLL